MLTCEHLEISRENRQLFSGLGVTLLPASLLVITGHNGSGKTTLLNIISGILKPDSGQISFAGKSTAADPEFQADTIYLSHKNALKLELTVRENVHFWAALHGNPELTDAALHFFQLEPYAKTPCARLSAGWQRRVALTRLITNPALIWLLDEPDTHLDIEGIKMLHKLIADRLRNNGIIILTTHHPEMLRARLTLSLGDFPYEQPATGN